MHCRDHAGSRRDAAIVPLANGGVALEAMARLLAVQAGERRRWVASAFSFRNIGRGYFHDAVFLDCDAEGLLDLEACSGLDPDSYDGLIVTNPFGMYLDFSRYADFAHRRGKALLIDNASGFHAALPDWPWQAFSLHHTKPYGFGEGGAALVPREHAEALYALVDYAADQGGSPHWLGNGKLSDVSSAFILERLERVGDWAPRYLEQRQRVVHLAERAGFSGLGAPQDGLPMTSLPAARANARDGAEHSPRPVRDVGKILQAASGTAGPVGAIRTPRECPVPSGRCRNNGRTIP
jgi:dTDP-4-amino-4,6-dideoxygalactose transaminase